MLPAEGVSPAEQQFDLWRRRLGLILCVPLALVAYVGAPDSSAQRLAAVMVFTAVLWISEAIPVAMTGLLSACLVVIFGIASPKEAFAAFSTPLLFLFFGSFFLAEGMKVHGLGERFAHAASRVAHSKIGVVCALSGASFALSLWISNTAATAVFLPIAVSVARATDDRRFGAALVIAIAYGASMGGIVTPIGTPPNLIGIAALRERGVIDIGFAKWVSAALPIGVAMLVVLWGLLMLRFRVGGGAVVKALARPPARWSSGEIAVAVCFGVAVVGWIAPGLVAAAGGGKIFAQRFPEEVVALVAAGMLFVWPVRSRDGAWRPALTWQEAARIDWGTVLLFGAGILLGDQAGKTGLAARWGDALVQATGAESLWAITALMTAGAILLSEATSNTATATLMVPLAISLAEAAKVSPIPPALGVTIGSSFGFMLPISTAPNAMAYGTGHVTIRQLASAGIVFDVLGYLVLLAGLRILCPLLGLA